MPVPQHLFGQFAPTLLAAVGDRLEQRLQRVERRSGCSAARRRKSRSLARHNSHTGSRGDTRQFHRQARLPHAALTSEQREGSRPKGSSVTKCGKSRHKLVPSDEAGTVQVGSRRRKPGKALGITTRLCKLGGNLVSVADSIREVLFEEP